ncbi:MAG TPA: SLC13 family permease, partial [Herpetosiphonaceae bacterium]
MSALSGAEWTLLLILGGAIGGIFSQRLPPDLVGLLALLALGLTGVLTADQALAGFSRPAVMTIIGLFVITAALERTGVVTWIADHLIAVSGSNERHMVLLFMGAGALLSLAMNNIAAGAVLLPAAVRVAHQARRPPSKLLMPLAFSTLLGGQATLFTTANIILSGSLQAQGLPPLRMLDFLPIGGITVLVGLAYLATIGRRLLPVRETIGRSMLARPDLVQTYALAERLWEVRILPGSPWINQPLLATHIGAQYGTTVIALWHGREAKLSVDPQERLAANDILLVLGAEDRVRALADYGTNIGRNGKYRTAMTELAVQLTEVIIAPRSPALGMTLKELRFRSKFGVTAVGVWRGGRSYRTDIGDFRLQAGDALLLVGPPAGIASLAQEPGFIVLDVPVPHPPAVKAGWAVLIALAV